MDIIKNTLEAEANAIFDCAENDGILSKISMAAKEIDKTDGLLIVAGIGKSGHIGRKIASTFSSLGKSSVFLHAAEASHGDLGIVQDGSTMLILSNSGETTELSDTLHYCKRHNISIISITSNSNSTLAKASSISISYGTIKEACPNGLAPTTSTTLSLAIGDALAVSVASMRGVNPEDFRKYHPGGKLGSRLLSAKEIMITGDLLPIVAPNASMQEVVDTMSQKALGAAIVVENNRAVGIITDGDLRRRLKDAWLLKARDIATKNPLHISTDTLASKALSIMNAKKITLCIVNDDAGKFIGIVHIHHCLMQGVTE